jgi:hypothetical protein
MMGGNGGGLGGAGAAGAAATGDGVAAGAGAGAAAVAGGDAVMGGWLPPSAAHPANISRAGKTRAERKVNSMISPQKRVDLADRSHRPMRRLRKQTLG